MTAKRRKGGKIIEEWIGMDFASSTSEDMTRPRKVMGQTRLN